MAEKPESVALSVGGIDLPESTWESIKGLPDLASGVIGRLSGGLFGGDVVPESSIVRPKETPAPVRPQTQAAPAVPTAPAAPAAPEAPSAPTLTPEEIERQKLEQMAKGGAARPEKPFSEYVQTPSGKNELNRTLALMGMDDSDRKEIAEGIKLPGFVAKLEDSKKKYDEAVAKMGEQKAITSMFAILGHLAVGMYGVQHGVDTSGVKFDVADWAAEYKKIKDNYEMETSLAETEYKSAESRRDKLARLVDQIKSSYESREARRKATEERDIAEAASFAKSQILQDAALTKQEKAMTAAREKEERAKQFSELKAIDAELVKAAQAKTESAKTSIYQDTAKKIGGLSFEDWKSEGTGRDTFLGFGWNDSQHYAAYVMGLARQHAKENLPLATAPATPASPTKPVDKAPVSGMIKYQKPDGSIKQAPASSLESIKAAGYTILN